MCVRFSSLSGKQQEASLEMVFAPQKVSSVACSVVYLCVGEIELTLVLS